MKTRFTLVVFLAAVAAACGPKQDTPAQGTAGLSWYDSLDEACTAAEETGDMILISFEASWCPWSALVRESLYVNQAVAESLSTAKCVVVEAPTDTTLRKEFGVVVYPTIVLADAYGGELGRMVGYHSPQEFLGRLDEVRHSKERLSRTFRREESFSEDPNFLLAFGRLLLEIGMYEGALIRFDRAMRVDQDAGPEITEEAEYSLAETYMLSGKYREAGRRFRILAERLEDGERSQNARILAGVCYQRAGYKKVATGIFEDYLEAFDDGGFAAFARAMLDSLSRGANDGS
jgi:tetratricopeptide (TPR) repeat protein